MHFRSKNRSKMSVEGMKLVEMLLVQRVGTSKGLQDFLSINFRQNYFELPSYS